MRKGTKKFLERGAIGALVLGAGALVWRKAKEIKRPLTVSGVLDDLGDVLDDAVDAFKERAGISESETVVKDADRAKADALAKSAPVVSGPPFDCEVCKNFTWEASFMKPVGGHHPSCSVKEG